jgi:hypothetical protein
MPGIKIAAPERTETRRGRRRLVRTLRVRQCELQQGEDELDAIVRREGRVQSRHGLQSFLAYPSQNFGFHTRFLFEHSTADRRIRP